MRTIRYAGVLFSLLLSSAALRAELISFDIRQRVPFAGGKEFGKTGAYEKIVAVARFALDPKLQRNKVIVDLDLAPRNEQGKVEFETDVVILAPKDPAKGNGAIFYDVNNRGNKLALRFFNFAPGGNDLDKAKSEGDGFLMRRGYTVVWCGWSGEMLPGEGRMLLAPPTASDNGKPIRGIVRFEMSTDKPADSLPLARREGHGSYAPSKEGEANGKLTWRMREGDPRIEIPRGQWSIERMPIPKVKDGVSPRLGQVRLKLAGGFRPGYLYELICECEGPVVQGVGFAAVRDLISFLRHDAGERNPIRLANSKPALKRAHGFGVSQSGRFLRNFVYLRFNDDERGRLVFDGLMPHVAGGGLGFFNHRFAQPTRFAGQHEDHTYPIDYFPFTYGKAIDPFTRRKPDSILKDSKRNVPKIMHTQSAAEYWHRSGSLVHTDPLGKMDAEIPGNVRIYAFGGTQHGPAADPPPRGIADNLNNPGDYRPFLRALLDALDLWVTDNTEPPASLYPRIDRKTLVSWKQKSTGFPAIPGIRYPEVIHEPLCLDYGFSREGIINFEPPEVIGKYVVLVPKSGSDGNDLGTLLPPEVGVPLATYTGWNLRRREFGAEAMLANLLGSYIPFAKTKAERMANGDPRPSLEERYETSASYQKQFGENCTRLIKGRYLLEEDAQRLIAARTKVKSLFPE